MTQSVQCIQSDGIWGAQVAAVDLVSLCVVASGTISSCYVCLCVCYVRISVSKKGRVWVRKNSPLQFQVAAVQLHPRQVATTFEWSTQNPELFEIILEMIFSSHIPLHSQKCYITEAERCSTCHFTLSSKHPNRVRSSKPWFWHKYFD